MTTSATSAINSMSRGIPCPFYRRLASRAFYLSIQIALIVKILSVVGARPNFMKIAPIMRAIEAGYPDVQQVLVHTGQHFDAKMSDVFFDDLGLPKPDEHLGVSGGSHAAQTAKIMLEFEPILLKHQPDWLVVVGDVNSTVACSLVASKLGIKIAHVEAGLRSRDNTMPEEINRKITDAISDLLLTPSPDGDANLLAEGVSPNQIVCVGNVMIDSLIHATPQIDQSGILDQLQLEPKQYVLATLHRPSNVDDRANLAPLLETLAEVAATTPLIWPVHPRARATLSTLELPSAIRTVDPVGYLDSIALQAGAALVLTDSGGMQEETTVLGVPCVTLRTTTERPITVSHGTNQLAGTDPAAILAAVQRIRDGAIVGRRPDLWDGRTAHRVVDALDRATP